VTFFAPIARADAVLARRNPVAKLLAAAVFGFALLITLDPVPPALALAVELASLPLFGVAPFALARRAWPVLLSGAGVGVAQTLFGTGGAETSVGLALRVPAVALPGVIVFATTDPTDLADALVQNARVPARFAIGALAAFRLMPLLIDEWRLLRLARRARGLAPGRNPLAQARQYASLTFAILVSAIRRGTRLATAMDARGFDARVPRTHARFQPFTRADAALIAVAAALAVAIVIL
jgi:energy-coupling factor transport system permease protein